MVTRADQKGFFRFLSVSVFSDFVESDTKYSYNTAYNDYIHKTHNQTSFVLSFVNKKQKIGEGAEIYEKGDEKRNEKSFLLIFSLIFFVIFAGCAGLEVALENQNVGVVSNLDEVPFFDSYPGQKVYVSIKNFSDYKDLDLLTSLVAERYQKRGFVIVNSLQKAAWVVEAKIVNIKKEDLSARQIKGTSSQEAGMTGSIYGGFVAGANAGSWRSAVAGALIGGILSGAANLTVNSWVKLGYLTIVTDIQVKQRVHGKVVKKVVGETKTGGVKETVSQEGNTTWIKYRFQALTRAKKVNLKWEDCKDAMIKEISRIVASLL